MDNSICVNESKQKTVQRIFMRLCERHWAIARRIKEEVYMHRLIK